MSLVGRCKNCTKPFFYRNGGNKVVLEAVEDMGKRLVQLATEPVDPHFNLCDDCLALEAKHRSQ